MICHDEDTHREYTTVAVMCSTVNTADVDATAQTMRIRGKINTPLLLIGRTHGHVYLNKHIESAIEFEGRRRDDEFVMNRTGT